MEMSGNYKMKKKKRGKIIILRQYMYCSVTDYPY